MATLKPLSRDPGGGLRCVQAGAYDQMAPLIGWDRARTSTFFDPTAVHGDASVDGVLFWRLRGQVGERQEPRP